MFTFDFFHNSDEESIDCSTDKASIEIIIPSQEVNINFEEAKKILEDIGGEHLTIDGIKYMSDKTINTYLENFNNANAAFRKAIKTQTDRVSAIYEGGAKIWECTFDLLTFIKETAIDLKQKRILDLGCGTGLIGTKALLKGGIVYFQDYNEDVIKYITIPTTILNTNNEVVRNCCNFFSGDWSSFADIIASTLLNDPNKFDYIFTSETIYDTKNYEKLCTVFEKLLNRDGVVYLAAKTYYFGVGGGIREFEEFLQKRGCWKYEICWRNVDGVHREILQITFV